MSVRVAPPAASWKRRAWRVLVGLLTACTVVVIVAWAVVMGRALATNRAAEYGYRSGSTRYAAGVNAAQVYVARIIRYPGGPPPPNQTGVVSMGRGLEAGSVYPVEWSHDFREAYYSANAADTYDVGRPRILPHWQRVIEMDRKLVVVRIWPCVLTLALLPAVAGARAIRRAYVRRRACRTGHCRHCGYDLRATPDRCPECGAAALQSIAERDGVTVTDALPRVPGRSLGGAKHGPA